MYQVAWWFGVREPARECEPNETTPKSAGSFKGQVPVSTVLGDAAGPSILEGAEDAVASVVCFHLFLVFILSRLINLLLVRWFHKGHANIVSFCFGCNREKAVGQNQANPTLG